MRTFEDWFDEHAIMWSLPCDTRMISWAEEVWAAAIEEAQNCLTAAGHSEAAGLLFSGEPDEGDLLDFLEEERAMRERDDPDDGALIYDHEEGMETRG